MNHQRSVSRKLPAGSSVRRFPRTWSAAFGFALVLLGCGQRLDSGSGFSLRVPAALQVAPVELPGRGRLLEVAYRAKPECLHGSIESFGSGDGPQQYFRKLNEETDLARRRPFLARDAHPSRHGSVWIADLEAFDEDAGAYRPAVVAAFPGKGGLWIAWLYVRCEDERMRALARDLLLSVDRTR